ncbi:3-oxoacyl-(acyl-carrier-protein) synthase III [Candidatus Accumulibacter aalborgensis]|uniref:Beta-ketoacyl-[acyl-carrier-protein] synthase III n=1 Tax=Candidatus Accumulibacter aalborgensis TaxID=1860102 RepID=A0A1A8XIZ7_9PROT|nr:beta-ketoacyl-ACP synthase III [Candidatus Accumulibacter aalborgensis]SBT04352.1 3-oxoacyl-(acyl-carrier-protein) synthase III [Candidatus Accumulibacter aalborgensis]
MFSRLAGIGSFLPGPAVSNDDLARRGIETSDEWVTSRTGIKFRHLAENGETASDLAVEASRRALAAAGLDAGDLDLIIVATSTPDVIFPSTACLLQSKLGNHGATAFDIQAVCSGFVYALTVADKFIQSGSHRRALVVGAEVFSKILDWSDRATCVLFGDGAGAVVLEAAEKPGILATALHADGSYHGILSVPGSVCGGKVTGDPFLRMDGQSVFKFAVRALAEVADECCRLAGVPQSGIDWLIPHQANIRILEATARKMKLPMDKVVVTVDRHGNTSAASVPLALDEAVRDGRIVAGQKVLLEGVGGGFTWGAVLFEL